MSRYKSPLTAEYIAQITNRKLCKGCKHHLQNGNNLICGLTNNRPEHNGSCKEFEMKDEQLLKRIDTLRSEAFSLRNKAQWWMEIGGMISVLLVVVICMQIKQFPNHHIAILLTIMACIILAVSVWMYFDLHEQSHKLEISALDNFAKLNRVSSDDKHYCNKKEDIKVLLIMDLLKEKGYAPQQYDDAVIFKYGHLNIIINYAEGFLTMQARYGLSKEETTNLGTLSKCADEFMKSTNLIKVLVIDDTIIYAIEAHMIYMDEFERYFERFAHWLGSAHNRVMNVYSKLVDPAFERIYIYSLAYRLLPLFVRGVSQKEIPISALWNEEVMKNELRNKERHVDELDLAKFRVLSVNDYGEIKQVVYQFPEPKIAPEAKYGAVLVNTRTLECQYYTLEMSDNERWFYCGVNNNKQHLNYGEAKNSDLESFLTWVLGNEKTIEAQSLTR